jgi:hypothetical protein
MADKDPDAQQKATAQALQKQLTDAQKETARAMYDTGNFLEKKKRLINVMSKDIVDSGIADAAKISEQFGKLRSALEANKAKLVTDPIAAAVVIKDSAQGLKDIISSQNSQEIIDLAEAVQKRFRHDKLSEVRKLAPLKPAVMAGELKALQDIAGIKPASAAATQPAQEPTQPVVPPINKRGAKPAPNSKGSLMPGLSGFMPQQPNETPKLSSLDAVIASMDDYQKKIMVATSPEFADGPEQFAASNVRNAANAVEKSINSQLSVAQKNDPVRVRNTVVMREKLATSKNEIAAIKNQLETALTDGDKTNNKQPLVEAVNGMVKLTGEKAPTITDLVNAAKALSKLKGDDGAPLPVTIPTRTPAKTPPVNKPAPSR